MSDNRDNLMLPSVWQPGEPVSSRKLNQLVDAEARRQRGVIEGANIKGGVYAVSKVFVITAIKGDYLECASYEAETDTDDDDVVYVARNYLLRCSITERNGITYVYSSTQQRVATNSSGSETQVIVPSYAVGDLIVAKSNLIGGIALEAEDGTTIEWIDENQDARAWAKKQGT